MPPNTARPTTTNFVRCNLEQTQLQLNLGDSRFGRVMIPFVLAGQEAGGHDPSPVDGFA